MQANASKHKAVRYGRMKDRDTRLPRGAAPIDGVPLASAACNPLVQTLTAGELEGSGRVPLERDRNDGDP